MKKNILFFIVSVLIIALLPMGTNASILPTQDSDNPDIDIARKAGESFVIGISNNVQELSSWQSCKLVDPTVYHNLDCAINAYMFAISCSTGIVGYVLVGSKAYGFPIFEASNTPPPSIPSNTMLLVYLGVDGKYAITVNDEGFIGTNLEHGNSVRMSEMKEWLPAPSEYLESQELGNLAKRILPDSPYNLLFTSNFLPMGYYSNGNRKWCGPCSGVSIGHYYKYYSETGTTYPNLYSDDAMYDSLYTNMQANPDVINYNYGPGFVYMTNECYYNNFRGDFYPFVGGAHYFDRIVPDIDNGWPHALLCWPENGHWRAIKGYDYTSGSHLIICTNSASSSSWEYLNWDVLPSSQHDTVRIRDNG